MTHKLEDARDYLYQRLVEILIAYKSSMTAGGAGASAQLAVSENMKMLPVLILGLLKNVSVAVLRTNLLMTMSRIRLVYVKARRSRLTFELIRKHC